MLYFTILYYIIGQQFFFLCNVEKKTTRPALAMTLCFFLFHLVSIISVRNTNPKLSAKANLQTLSPPLQRRHQPPLNRCPFHSPLSHNSHERENEMVDEESGIKDRSWTRNEQFLPCFRIAILRSNHLKPRKSQFNR